MEVPWSIRIFSFLGGWEEPFGAVDMLKDEREGERRNGRNNECERLNT